MKNVLRIPFVTGALLLLCALLLSGLTSTVCALASARAAHDCCDNGTPCSAAECGASGCQCPACALDERQSDRLLPHLVEVRFTFPLLDSLAPRLLRSDSIDYPPEIA